LALGRWRGHLSYYLSLQGGLKFKALRGKESAVRAPQLKCQLAAMLNTFHKTVFERSFALVMGTLAINFDDI
jgi:hypothetical protein